MKDNPFKIFFLHNHYIPKRLREGSIKVESVIIPEFYPDLNRFYLNDLCYFNTVDSYIDYVTKGGIYPANNVYAIENINILNKKNIDGLLFHYKQLGIKIIQLFSGKDSEFFCSNTGLTTKGIKLLDKLLESEMILDLSHLPDHLIINIAFNFPGKKIVSHCACSDLYLLKERRSNSLTSNTIQALSDQIEIFGIPFLNDIIASKYNEKSHPTIYHNIISNILKFHEIVGSKKVALAPDYIDTYYFSRKFQTQLIIPENLLTLSGLSELYYNLCAYLSNNDVNNIFYKNVERLLATTEILPKN